ncbi:MAG: hypothetical protein FD160_2602, partial [Caulobacteraceae bacterium]
RRRQGARAELHAASAHPGCENVVRMLRQPAGEGVAPRPGVAGQERARFHMGDQRPVLDPGQRAVRAAPVAAIGGLEGATVRNLVSRGENEHSGRRMSGRNKKGDRCCGRKKHSHVSPPAILAGLQF